jgi:serine/threonine kinase 32
MWSSHLHGAHQQSKKANFDASHELEELLLEDNPLKARQRKVQDISNLSSEMRQMEEQYVKLNLHRGMACIYMALLSVPRFTSYDFKKMQRRSYYPSNQQIETQITTMATGTSSTGAISRPVTPGTEIGQMDSMNGSTFVRKPSHEPDQREAIPMGDVNNEKSYAV